jgi:uncharacterized membrane protein
MLDELVAPTPVSPHRRRTRHRMGVGLLCLVAAALYTACGLAQFATFRAGTYDLVIFDQAVRSYSHFQLPISVAKGVHNGFGTGFAVLGDHFSPILALLAPLYWIHDAPQTLLVAQGLLFASAIVPLWTLARRELGVIAAYGVSIGYALSWPIAQAVTFDFHEVAFAPVLTAFMFERISAWRRGTAMWWHLVVVALLLLAVKEDAGLLVVGFGLAIIATSPRNPRQAALGAALAAGGLASVLLTTRLVIPAFGGRLGYYWHYARFGDSPLSAAMRAISGPVDTVRTFVQPSVKQRTLWYLLAIGALAPLASPYVVVPLPLLAERMLSDAPHWWSTDFHYNAFLVVPILGAGIDAVARLQRRCEPVRASRVGALWASAVVVVAVAIAPTFAYGQLTRASFWSPDADARAAADVLDHVPAGVTVEVPNNLGPHVSGRDTVVLLDHLPRWAPWVVVDAARVEFPFCELTEQQQRLGFLTRHGYRVVYGNDGYLLLHHGDPVPALNTKPSPGC